MGPMSREDAEKLLRECFAMSALQGILAAGLPMAKIPDRPELNKDGCALRAAWAYLQADAMMAERRRSGG